MGPTTTWVRETLQNTYSTDYLRKQSAGLFRPNALAVVDCDNLLGKTFLLDGVLCEVVEVDESTKLAKSMRGHRQTAMRKWVLRRELQKHAGGRQGA
jgi:hypothetical protein